MRHYEVTFIVDPVLSGDEIKTTAKTYEDMLKKEGAKIVYIDEMGLRQLAYPLNKRSSGIYYCVEFSIEEGSIVSKLELALRRDERIIRFLTIKLDKYGVKYNEDKRNGLIGKVQRPEKKSAKKDNRSHGKPKSVKKPAAPAPAPAPAPKPAPAPAPAPVVATKEEE